MNRLCLSARLPLRSLLGGGSRVCSRRVNAYHTDHGVYGYRPRRAPAAVRVDETALQNRITHSNLLRLVTAYREHGHYKAQIDPLHLKQPQERPELDPAQYGFSSASSEEFPLQGIVNMAGHEKASLTDIIAHLENMYCSTMAVEFEHMLSMDEREWFAERFEQLKQEELASDEKVELAKIMSKSEAFDHFLATKFSTVKRYGGEGAESAMPFYNELFQLAAKTGIEDIVLCIAHRGRLNLLSCLLEFPVGMLFKKMKGQREFPPDVVGSGDVLSHLTASVDLKYDDDQVHVTMVPNPSHLEAVNPVAVGKARARQQSRRLGDYTTEEMDGTSQPGDKVLCVQIHGDAAFAGQGIVAETFAVADVPHFSVGGSVHLIINNQVGFTTQPERGRSAIYSSCIAKLNGHPVIHVNADYPEDVVRACRLALEYREKFRQDIIVDLVCFRKWGHNEVDDPSLTQPIMYNAIRSRESIPEIYARNIVEQELCSKESIDEHVREWSSYLNQQLAQLDSFVPKANHLEQQWAGLVQAPPSVTRWDTGVPVDSLKYVGAKSVELPSDMDIHPTLQKTHVNRRLQRMEEGAGIDWGTAETLAVGSLLQQGFNVRISGQDVGRGTFSQRHWMLVDQNSDAGYVPLNYISSDQNAFLEVCNSILSEEAVLAYEYGMSIENPKILVIWEAQFGDFFNAAQVIIDTFVTCGETKWLLQSGLVMLLPHGIDGTGPDHSSCRMERFLQMVDSKEDGIDGDDVNFQCAHPTTPAQYFHLLRRQMVRNYRKPLVIAGPKILLRHSDALSTLSEMAPGTSFQPVLGDPTADPAKVKKVVFVSGKQYYTLKKEQATRGVTDMAVIRLEELCPFPADAIREELKKYSNASEFVWSQEEHRNHGAWNFVAPRFENVVGKKLRYVGRAVHATPATGVGAIHRQEAQDIIDATFA